MRALLLDKPGKPESLYEGTLPDPQPGPEEILVRVRAAGLNPVDYKLAAGGNRYWVWPHVLGLDVAGDILEVGEKVEGKKPGDRVVFHGNLTRRGGFAEQVVTVGHVVAPIPDGVSYEMAAAVPCAGFTAWIALHDRLRITPGQTVLVLGGAGGVGGFSIQLARLAGCRVLATCSPEKAAFVRSLGADEAIDYHQPNLVEYIRSLTEGFGIDAVVDAVSSESASQGLRTLGYGGGLAAVAGRPEWSAVTPFTTSPSVHEISLGAIYRYGRRSTQERLAVIGTEMTRLVRDGKLDPMVTRVLNFAEIPAGLSELESRRVQGKLVAALP